MSLLKVMAAAHDHDMTCLLEAFFDSSFNSLGNQINIEGHNLQKVQHPNDKKKGGFCMHNILKNTFQF